VHHAIHTPSGLIGVVRRMTMQEEKILTDRNLARSGGQVDALLRACWVEALEPGPYTIGDEPLDWSTVLQCDRFHTLIHIRVATYGPNYSFATNCESCRSRIEWEVDLTELPVRALSDESRAAFVAGNRFETRLPDAGVRAWFKLMTGADERRLPQLRKQSQDRPLSALLTYRVLEIEGIDGKEKRAFIENLSMRDANHLVNEFERVDGGIEAAIQIECPDCFAVQDVEIPFDSGPFMPSRTAAKRRPASAASSLR
jgi:hypothetical protein